MVFVHIISGDRFVCFFIARDLKGSSRIAQFGALDRNCVLGSVLRQPATLYRNVRTHAFA